MTVTSSKILYLCPIGHIPQFQLKNHFQKLEGVDRLILSCYIGFESVANDYLFWHSLLSNRIRTSGLSADCQICNVSLASQQRS